MSKPNKTSNAVVFEEEGKEGREIFIFSNPAGISLRATQPNSYREVVE